MKVLFLIQGFEVPSSRYRVLQYLPALKEAGIDATVTPFPETLAEEQRIYSGAGEYDVVFLHRKRLSKFWIRTLRKAAKKIVYDFDDAVMFRDTLSVGEQESVRRRRRFERTCKMADLVIAGNSYLAGFAKPLNPNTVILPTVIDMARYPSDPRGVQRKASGDSLRAQAPSVITLGWIGDTGSLAYLEAQRPLLEAIGKAVPNLQFKVISSRFPKYENLPVIPAKWTAETEVAELRTFDIGVMPVPDDPWSKGKCGLKLLQYMAAGVPSVASPVGANADILQDGVQGFHAATETQWIEAIRKLAGDVKLRARMGEAAYRRVLEGYSLQSAAPRFTGLLNSLVQAAT